MALTAGGTLRVRLVPVTHLWSPHASFGQFREPDTVVAQYDRLLRRADTLVDCQVSGCCQVAERLARGGVARAAGLMLA
jgi:hypothetical protein